MEQTPTWYLIIQCIVSVAIVGTFIIYWRQLVAMRGQLDTMRESNKNQNFLNLVEFMNVESRRLDRRKLIELGKSGKLYQNWTSDEKDFAERVCGSYNLVGLSVREKMVPRDITIKGFRDSIIKCYAATKELLIDYRKTRGSDFWDNFDWLVEEINKNNIQ